MDYQTRQLIDEIEHETDTDTIRTALEKQALKKATKFERKNAREIKRLKAWAGQALLDNRKDRYAYAIRKLRGFYRQPCTSELIDAMWNSSKGAIVDIAKSEYDRLKAELVE